MTGDTTRLPLHELTYILRFPPRIPFRVNDSLSQLQDALYTELEGLKAIQEIEMQAALGDDGRAVLATKDPPYRFVVNIRKNVCAVSFRSLERSQITAAQRIIDTVVRRVDGVLSPPLFLQTAVAATTVVYLYGSNKEVFAERLLGDNAFQGEMPLAVLPFGAKREGLGRADLKIGYDIDDKSSVFVTVECPANLDYHTVWLKLEVVHPEGAVPPKSIVLGQEYFSRFTTELDTHYADFVRRLLPDGSVDPEETARIMGSLAMEDTTPLAQSSRPLSRGPGRTMG